VRRSFNILEGRHASFLSQFIQSNWGSMAQRGAPMHVEITDAKAKRSSQANRYYWRLLNQVAEEGWVEGRQYSAEVWHELFKRRFIGCIDMPNGQTMAESSAKLNISEFSAYTMRVEQFAASELGITLIEDAEPMGRIS